MENVKMCSKCNTEMVTGTLAGYHIVEFYPQGDEHKFKPRHSTVICDACPNCGCIESIRLLNPKRIVSKNK